MKINFQNKKKKQIVSRYFDETVPKSKLVKGRILFIKSVKINQRQV